MNDIYEVLRKKQAQQAVLQTQIEALQVAAHGLDAVKHLLQDQDEPLAIAQRATI